MIIENLNYRDRMVIEENIECVPVSCCEGHRCESPSKKGPRTRE